MAPARCFGDRAGSAPDIVEITKPSISIGLEEPGIAGEMPIGVFAVTIAGVKEERRRRVGTGEGPVIPDISPHPPCTGFSFGQHRHGRVVAVEALGAEHVIPN
jgi:hypothetical protein